MTPPRSNTRSWILRTLGWRALAVAGAATGTTAAAAYQLLASQHPQRLGHFPYQGTCQPKRIAITFDDGPNPPWTARLADVLATQDVRATFFEPGACAARFPDLTRRLVAEGHVIGNHSYHHDIRRLWRRSDLHDEIARTQEVLTPLVGHTPTLYRPPWLFRPPALFDEARKQGLTLVGGEFCHPAEVFQPNPGVLVAGTLARARDGLILIFHDGYNTKGADRASTVAAIDRVIPLLRDRGFEFTTVDRLLGLDP